jgi:hypothetical protein
MAFLTYWHLKETRSVRAKKAGLGIPKTFKASAKVVSALLD